ncbi:MAG: DUF305 domain-containing protein [Pseudomonadota bacterium]
MSLFRVLAAIAGFASVTAFADPPIVQPGAPGETPRTLSADEATEIADTSYTPDDVRFMQGMIPHHEQALEMARLVAERTNNADVVDIAGRIESSQGDEIEFMNGWLSDRSEASPEADGHHSMHMHHQMAGMASPEQMAALADASGTDFDRLFLELMITHHEGALKMVEDLLEQPGAAYDPVLFEFTNDINNDQTSEIERMNGMLVALSSDPRAGLAPGITDAETAISNLELIVTLARPDGFFDPANPGDLPLARLEAKNETAPVDDAEDSSDEEEEKAKKKKDPRTPLLSFANTDMAFREDVLVTGSYHGFNVYEISDTQPELMASIVCPGGQGDVSIVGDLLIMSVEQTRGRLDCGLEGIAEDVSDARFRGLRIFDISALTRPVQVGAVQTCRGSHTHSVVSGPGRDGKIIVYNSGTSVVRDTEELEGCYDETPGDDRTALFRIDVIEIPVDNPGESRIIDSPAVFADPDSGVLAGLWRGGDHGDETQRTRKTDQCHDITVFPTANIAAGACSGNGIIFDISNPRKPKRIDAVVDEGFAYWHSATFNNDGTKVVFTDEWGGGSRPRCRAHDPLDWGADAIYDIVDGKLEYRSHYKMPGPQMDTENCVAHNGSIVPVPGRDLFVQAWYQGGLSVMDFTDSAEPVEIAFFDRGPIDEESLVLGGYWSTYWYDGLIYGTEIVRGLDVFELLPSEHLTENEINAAKLANQGAIFNPQQQLPVSWPAEPVVARAYIDQLQRDDALPAALAQRLELQLARVETALSNDSKERNLAKLLKRTTREINELELSGQQSRRQEALSRTLRDIADRLN